MTIAITPEIRLILFALRRDILNTLMRDGSSVFRAARLRSTVSEINDLLAGATEALDKTIENIAHASAELSAERTGRFVLREIADVRGDDVRTVAEEVFRPTITRSELIGITRYRTDLIRGVMADTQDRIRTELQIGVLREESPAELGRRISGASFDPKAPRARGHLQKTYSEAVTIARTEAARGSSAARHEILTTAERSLGGKFETWKTWSPVVDQRSRIGHVVAGQHPPVRLSGFFTVWSTNSARRCELRYPLDADGRPSAYVAENTIACRCVLREKLMPAGAAVQRVDDVMRDRRMDRAVERELAARAGE